MLIRFKQINLTFVLARSDSKLPPVQFLSHRTNLMRNREKEKKASSKATRSRIGGCFVFQLLNFHLNLPLLFCTSSLMFFFFRLEISSHSNRFSSFSSQVYRLSLDHHHRSHIYALTLLSAPNNNRQVCAIEWKINSKTIKLLFEIKEKKIYYSKWKDITTCAHTISRLPNQLSHDTRKAS